MLSIIQYTTTLDKSSNHHSNAPLPSGASVFLILFNNDYDPKQYYRFCYLKEEDAKLAMENINICFAQVKNYYIIVTHNFYDDPEQPEHITDLNAGKEE